MPAARIVGAVPRLQHRGVGTSRQVADRPCSLLLEVQVGGGTDIGPGLRARRSGPWTVPPAASCFGFLHFEEGAS